MKTNRLLNALLLLVSFIVGQNEKTLAQQSLSDESIERLKELSDFSNWPGKNGPVRDGINLSQHRIVALAEAAERPVKPSSFFIWETEEETLLARYSSQWYTSSESFLQIDLTFGNTCDEVHEYLIEKFFNSSMPFELRVHKKDNPIVAGDLSFDNGRYFLRNNVVVEFQGHGEMSDKIAQVAKEVDGLLLTRATAASAHGFKPVIKQFAITGGSVKHLDLAKLTIEVTDPQGSALYYFWRMTSGGIDKDAAGNHYYFSEGEVGTEQTISLIVVNDRGYYSTSDIVVRIE